MADISIERMTLRLPASAERGERLMRKVADGLAGISLSRGYRAEIPGLDVSLRRAPNESDDALAGRIVAELMRQLDRVA